MRNPKILTKTLVKTLAKPVATVPTDDASPGQPTSRITDDPSSVPKRSGFDATTIVVAAMGAP